MEKQGKCQILSIGEYEIFSDRLKTRMNAKNLSANQLGIKSGVSRQQIGNFLNKKGATRINQTTLDKLSKALECDLDYLFGKTDFANDSERLAAYLEESSNQEVKPTMFMWVLFKYLGLADDTGARLYKSDSDHGRVPCYFISKDGNRLYMDLAKKTDGHSFFSDLRYYVEFLIHKYFSEQVPGPLIYMSGELTPDEYELEHFDIYDEFGLLQIQKAALPNISGDEFAKVMKAENEALQNNIKELEKQVLDMGDKAKAKQDNK